MKAPNRNNIDTLARDWKTFLGVFAVLVLVVAAAHAYLIYRVGKGDIFVTDPVMRDEAIVQQKKTVRNVNTAFEKKRADYEAFEIARPEEKDPSLDSAPYEEEPAG